MTEDDDSWLEGGPAAESSPPGGGNSPATAGELVPLYGLTKRQLAAAFGVSLKTINRWCLDGLPARSSGSKKGGLRFDLPAAIEWRRAADLAEQGGGDESLAEAKRRNAMAQARRRELENAKLEGELFPMDLLLRVVTDRYTRFAKRLQRIELEAFGLNERQRDDIEKAMDDALRDISVMKFSEDLQLEESSERSADSFSPAQK